MGDTQGQKHINFITGEYENENIDCLLCHEILKLSLIGKQPTACIEFYKLLTA